MAKKTSHAKTASVSSDANNVVHAGDADFDQVIKTHPLCVVDIFATWCPPCKRLMMAMEQKIIPHFAGKNVTFVKVDSDEASKLSQRFEIDSVPQLMFWKNGERVSFQFPNDNGKLESKDKIEGFADFLTDPIIKVIEQLLT
jgi:thioredoxin-like negative regulator of GroEL